MDRFREQLRNYIVDNFLFGDDKGFEMTQSIPLVGKLYYWWFGKGAKKLEKKEAEQKKKEGKGILSSLKSMNEDNDI